VVAKHDYEIPGLISEDEIADSYNPRKVLYTSEEKQATLERFDEFLSVYDQSMLYGTEEVNSRELDLAVFMARLIGSDASAIKSQLKVSFTTKLTFGAEKSTDEQLENVYDLLKNRFTSVVDYLLSLAGQGELPPRFEISSLKETKALLSSLDNTQSLAQLASFAKDLTKYTVQVRKNIRIIEQGI